MTPPARQRCLVRGYSFSDAGSAARADSRYRHPSVKYFLLFKLRSSWNRKAERYFYALSLAE